MMAFEPGSVQQNIYLSTVQPQDIVPYGTTVDGYIAGANLQTSDKDLLQQCKYIVMYAIPEHILRSLVFQGEVSADTFNNNPYFTIPYPRGNSNKYDPRTCKKDNETLVCTQRYATIYKHTFEYLKGTEGLKGTFPLDYEGSHYIVFVPHKDNKRIGTNNITKSKEKLLGLSPNAQDVIVIILLVLIVIVIYQNQKLREKLTKK